MARPPKILTREDIERAMRVTLSNRAAARYLHTTYPTYRKYAELYKDENGVTLYEKHRNPSGKGIRKYAASLEEIKTRKKSPSLLDILEGRASATSYNPQQLKYKLIQYGYLEPKCYRCGYDKTRLLDGKAPLILVHKDGDKNNWNLSNLEFLCYNCAFIEGPNSIITDEMVERSEDAVTNRVGKTVESTFELDDYQRKYLEHILKS